MKFKSKNLFVFELFFSQAFNETMPSRAFGKKGTYSIVAFPRDGTSRCPFVPGQRNFLVPVSLCPGTRAEANVPGQTPLSRDVPGQNHLPKKAKKQEKVVVKQEKDVPKQEKEVPKQENEVPKQERTF
jgi:hypothetical protein